MGAYVVLRVLCPPCWWRSRQLVSVRFLMHYGYLLVVAPEQHPACSRYFLEPQGRLSAYDADFVLGVTFPPCTWRSRLFCPGCRGTQTGIVKDLATLDAHSFVRAGFDVPVAQFVQVRTSAIAPCIWQSLVRCSVFAFGVQEYGFFWKTTSGIVSVFNTPWFDSGYMSGVSLRGLLASTLQITADSLQLQFIKGRRHPCLYAVAIPYRPVCSENHRDSPVARRHDGRCPFRAGCTGSHVQLVGGTVVLPQFLIVQKSLCLMRTSRFTSPSRGRGKSMVQTVRLTMDILQLLITAVFSSAHVVETVELPRLHSLWFSSCLAARHRVDELMG